jgi:transcriptional regulator with XRE-family HTH domain
MKLQQSTVFVNKPIQFDPTGFNCDNATTNVKRTKDMSKLGERIRQARKEKGLSQPELAKKVGIKQQTLSQLERGYSYHTRYLQELATVLGVSKGWLLGETDENTLTYDLTNQTNSNISNKFLFLSKRVIFPILENSAIIIARAKYGILPEIYRSMIMEIEEEVKIGEKAFIMDITKANIFNTGAKMKCLAVIDPDCSPSEDKYVLIKEDDKKIKLRLCVRDGDQLLLRASHPKIPDIKLENATIVGGIVKFSLI